MPYVPSTKRAEALERTRRKITDATKAEFLALGWDKATIRGIAARAGVSTGSFFSIFHTKEEAWRSVTGLPTPNEWALEVLKKGA